MKIWLDMDGTIADLYAVDNWLDMLRAYDATPYVKAKPMTGITITFSSLRTIPTKSASN